MDKLLDKAKQIKVEAGLDETVDMGPLASKKQFETVSS
ncbi:aldehyde dehydrogenase family protein [Peribacillus frigoritolerans]